MLTGKHEMLRLRLNVREMLKKFIVRTVLDDLLRKKGCAACYSWRGEGLISG